MTPRKPGFRILTAISLAAVVAGCQTASIDDLAPRAADGRTAPNTGTYPNLNVVPTPETPQLTDAERDAKTAELRAARDGQNRGGSSGASEADLRRLARTHADAALREIESD